ncbi:hypothetical protein D3C71_1406000 [compost metagenome]
MLAEGAHRQFRGAGHDRTVANEVAIQRQRDARSPTHSILERGIAAGVPTGVEIGEAIQRLRVIHRIAEQMGDAEVHPATTGKDFTADRTVHRVGIILGLLLGKLDADLHRPAGVHRVEACEQRLAHGHHADEIIENRAQFLLAARRIQAIAVGFSIGRIDPQSSANQ